MFIIEGADGLGKTTVAKKIVAAGFPAFPDRIHYKHMSRPAEDFDFFRDYYTMMQGSLFSVQDRFHLGGLVWHENKISLDSLRIIEGWLQSDASVTVIFATQDFGWYRDHVLRLCSGREEMFSPDRILEGNKKYCSLLGQSYVRSDYVFWADRNKMFPDQYDIAKWTQTWERRLCLLGGTRRVFANH